MARREPGGAGAGVASGVLAYVLWGLFPLYWGFLEPASPLEVLAARVIFSLLCLVLLVSAVGQWRAVRGVLADRRSLLILAVAAAVVSVNWGTFIWAVDNDHVVDASLGYFINPLVSIALGVLVLREALRRLQWVAVAIAGLSVLYATAALGRPPWIALVLAFSFGCYGLAKKLAGVDAIPSLTVEMTLLTPVALAYIGWLWSRGALVFGSEGWAHAMLMAGAGPVTALPLLFFGFAAHRVPLSVLGPLQYVAPTLQLVIGVWLLDEPMSAQRWLAFVGVWIALVVFTVDAVRFSRSRLEPPLPALLAPEVTAASEPTRSAPAAALPALARSRVGVPDSPETWHGYDRIAIARPAVVTSERDGQMNDRDRIPALHLTLEHEVRTESGDWVAIQGLSRDGDDVVVTCCEGRVQWRVPASSRVAARSGGSGADPTDERDLDVRMAGWYAGDVDAAEHAVEDHHHPEPPEPARRVAYGHEVPDLQRDPELVGIYGGDLDHVVDALGAAADVDARARRQEAYARGMARAHHEEPVEDSQTDEDVEKQISGWYAGDLGSVTPDSRP